MNDYETIDTISAFELELNDLIRVPLDLTQEGGAVGDDIVEVTDLDEDDVLVNVTGYSHTLGETITFPLPWDYDVDLLGA